MMIIARLLTIALLIAVNASSEIAMRQLVVSGVDHSVGYDDSNFAFEKSWDNNPNTFFHAQLNGWAKYKIPMSTVEMVRLQNRADCCAERMTNNVVFVCLDISDASCKECGRVTKPIPIIEWADITCSDGIRGSIVKVQATNTFLQIAEIQIFAERRPLIEIPVSGGDHSPENDASIFPFETSWDNNPITFFIAQMNGWAKYIIPESTVRVVRLQNRVDCCAERMTNNVVSVCHNLSDASCKECGKVTSPIRRNRWAEISCTDGVRGSIVKVQATNTILQIAEVQIFTEGLPLLISGGEHSPDYDASKYPFEHSWDNDPDTFFHAQTNGWAKYIIPESVVRVVRLQNRGDCCAYRMTNHIVSVCRDLSDDSCKECGRVISFIKESSWAEIYCSGGILGSIVKVQATNTFLQIAEIDVYA